MSMFPQPNWSILIGAFEQNKYIDLLDTDGLMFCIILFIMGTS